MSLSEPTPAEKKDRAPRASYEVQIPPERVIGVEPYYSSVDCVEEGPYYSSSDRVEEWVTSVRSVQQKIALRKLLESAGHSSDTSSYLDQGAVKSDEGVVTHPRHDPYWDDFDTQKYGQAVNTPAGQDEEFKVGSGRRPSRAFRALVADRRELREPLLPVSATDDV